MIGRLTPVGMTGEFYGLFALSGRATAWLAPLAIVVLFVLHWGVLVAYLPQRAEAAGAEPIFSSFFSSSSIRTESASASAWGLIFDALSLRNRSSASVQRFAIVLPPGGRRKNGVL